MNTPHRLVFSTLHSSFASDMLLAVLFLFVSLLIVPTASAQGPTATSATVRTVFARAKTAEERGSVNFYGFYVGMPKADAETLVAHYGLGSGEFAFRGDPVYFINLSLKSVRQITKGGNSYGELLQAVANRVGSMSYNEGWSQRYPYYTYKTIDGIVIAMSELFDVTEALRGKVDGRNFMEGLFLFDTTGTVKNESNRKRLQSFRMVETATKSILDSMKRIPGKPYKMGRTEVTQAQWMAVMGYNPSAIKGDNLPVVDITWNECQEFLKLLMTIPAVKESGLVFRLPAREEWLYACLAGSTSSSYCLLENGTSITAHNLGTIAWFADNSGREIHPVGQKEPNAFGLYDMYGNVSEWMQTRTAHDDWIGSRAICGGSVIDGATFCKVADSRWQYEIQNRSRDNLGFRLCADVSEAERKELEKAEREKAEAEREKAEAERRAREEAQRIEHEKAEAELRAREEAQRIEREKAEAERRAWIEKAEAEQKAWEEAARIEREKAEAEQTAREEADRIEREKAEAERRAREESDLIEREKAEAERKVVEEAAEKVRKEAIQRKRDEIESRTRTVELPGGVTLAMVKTPDGPWFGRTEVTHSQWNAVMDAKATQSDGGTISRSGLQPLLLAKFAEHGISDGKIAELMAANKEISEVFDGLKSAFAQIESMGNGSQFLESDEFETLLHNMAAMLGEGAGDDAEDGFVDNGDDGVASGNGVSDFPVVNVSIIDCAKFVTILNGLPVAKDAGLRFRLPTRTEWRKASLAGGKPPFGSTFTGDDARICDIGWIQDWENPGLHPVAQRQPNAWGLCDMFGNVREFVGPVPTEDDAYIRAYGGSFRTPEENLRQGDTFNDPFWYKGKADDLGFRLCAEER